MTAANSASKIPHATEPDGGKLFLNSAPNNGCTKIVYMALPIYVRAEAPRYNIKAKPVA